MSKWMLVETFGGAEPSVIGVGSTPRRMVPLEAVLSRGRSLNAVEQGGEDGPRDGQ